MMERINVERLTKTCHMKSTHTYIHIHTYTHTYIHTYIHIYIHTYTHMYSEFIMLTSGCSVSSPSPLFILIFIVPIVIIRIMGVVFWGGVFFVDSRTLCVLLPLN